MRSKIYSIFYIIQVNSLNFCKNKHLNFFIILWLRDFNNNIKIRFSKKIKKNLYPLSKPPPKFGEILVIWGGLDKGFYGNINSDRPYFSQTVSQK